MAKLPARGTGDGAMRGTAAAVWMRVNNNRRTPLVPVAGRRQRRLARLVALDLSLALILAIVGIVIYAAAGDSDVAGTPPLSATTSDPPPVSSSTTVTTEPKPEKLIALTFDDGPSVYTPQVAAILEEKNTVATFFCVGEQVAKYSQIISRLKADGCELENHTWNHSTLTRLSPYNIHRQISRTSQALGGTKYLRPPGGRFNAAVLAEAHSLGLDVALWNIDTRDWKDRNAASILSRVREEARPGAVILMHDGGGDRSQTVAALPDVIDWLRSEGYTLVRLDQLGTKVCPGTIR